MRTKSLIEARKEINKMLKESRIAGKRQRCALCGDDSCAFCNSHSIPQFILRGIASNGHVLHPSAIVLNEDICEHQDVEKGEYFDTEKGVENSWTFHNICRKCDSTYFADYENEDALKLPFTNKMMAEIALKVVLHQLDKRAIEIKYYDMMQNKSHNIEGKEIQDEVQSLDVRDYEFEKRRAQKIIDRNLKSGYKLVFWKKLPYTVPYVLQTGVSLQNDICGKQINDTTNLSPNIRMETLYLVVFPLNGESVVSVFYHKDDRKYVKFEKEFVCLSEDEKISFINYTGIKYSENICASIVMKKVMKDNERLRQLFSEVNESPRYGMWNLLDIFFYMPVGEKEIPNLLSKEYSLEHLENKP